MDQGLWLRQIHVLIVSRGDQDDQPNTAEQEEGDLQQEGHQGFQQQGGHRHQTIGRILHGRRSGHAFLALETSTKKHDASEANADGAQNHVTLCTADAKLHVCRQLLSVFGSRRTCDCSLQADEAEPGEDSHHHTHGHGHQDGTEPLHHEEEDEGHPDGHQCCDAQHLIIFHQVRHLHGCAKEDIAANEVLDLALILSDLR
mmetsp:Transcript_37844/g.62406  ORF Transcript_37844/g.62406 Transcript_37844/m.62406 type:complete len:201 (-) Transcript_37844:640-1242(-)